MGENQAEKLMRRAIELAAHGFPAPNPHVGCVVAQGGVIVGEGFHDYAGGPHAEAAALQEAGEKARGATAYVTLEPCNHWGRTAPCSAALIEAGVKAVVFAVEDTNSRASGGAQTLRNAGIEVRSGLCGAEAEAVNEVFLTAQRLRRPYVAIKAACTLDGFMALPNGESQWITGLEARARGHWLRAQMGAVLVGANTVLYDDPQLTARIEGVVIQPVRIVLDPRNRVSANARLFGEPGETLHIVGQNASSAQVEVPLMEGRFDLMAVLAVLWSRGLTSILVEGGPDTIGGFLRERLFDRLDVFIAPKLFGEGLSFSHRLKTGSISDALHMVLQSQQRLGEDMWLSYRPHPYAGKKRA